MVVKQKATVNEKADGYRLPYADEWEFAAKGGQNFLYSGSDDVDDVAWYEERGTYPAGRKAPNAYGLYNMSGNIWEWYFDLKPSRESGQTSRILCGGGFVSDSAYCTVASRMYMEPSVEGDDCGFRVARTSNP